MHPAASSPSSDRPRLGAGVWLTALASLALHFLPQPGYGFHRDELLYLAMGDHLHLFRMSFPPLIAVLAETARALPLDLLAAVRLLPALAGAAAPATSLTALLDLPAQTMAALASSTFDWGALLTDGAGVALLTGLVLLTGAAFGGLAQLLQPEAFA